MVEEEYMQQLTAPLCIYPHIHHHTHMHTQSHTHTHTRTRMVEEEYMQ
jgi:hypothetical protein